MAQKLEGLSFLRQNEIKGMKCNVDKPYAFISYSHDEHDTAIVKSVFKIMYNSGCNLWIDTANMPNNSENWVNAAIDAMRNTSCKFVIFFRSENSMIKNAISKELSVAKDMEHINTEIVTVDIWRDNTNNAKEVLKNIRNLGEKKERENCEKICEAVDVDCNAIRYAEDCENDINNLAEKLIELCGERGIINASTATSSQKVTQDGVSSDCNLEATKALANTDITYKILTMGSRFHVGFDKPVTVKLNGKSYNGKMHSSVKGRIDGLSKFYKENKFNIGDVIKATYTAADTTVTIEKL